MGIFFLLSESKIQYQSGALYQYTGYTFNLLSKIIINKYVHYNVLKLKKKKKPEYITLQNDELVS